MQRLVALALEFRFVVLLATLLVVVLGVFSLQRLPIEGVPDITPNQVLVLTRAPSLSPPEVEKYISFPVEWSMSGLPGITNIYSLSKQGFSYVAIYFREDMDIYFCRRLVMERLAQARALIPPGMGSPEMGPISTGLGEIYQFKVTGGGLSNMELRSILDWDIAPKLRSVPGIVEVNVHGGELKTYEVQVDSDRMTAYRIPLSTIIRALGESNGNAGGAYLERPGQQQSLIRGEGLISSLEDIEKIVVGVSDSGTPITIRNVAQVRFAPMVRQGLASQDGNGEIVIGVAMLLIGENARIVVDRVKAELREIEQSLPAGVRIEPYYDRTDLVRRTIRTVTKNLVEGGLAVIAVLLLLLGTLKGGGIVAAAIPLSMLFAFTGMVQAGISGNLMSLGAIDFGLLVDGSVVMVENILRRLGQRKPTESALEVVRRAAQEVARPVFFGVTIIFLVYVPILMLQGTEGKMFRPMATTVLFALGASLVIALTLMPVLSWLAFRKRVPQEHTWLMRGIGAAYSPVLQRAMRRPLVTFGVATLLFLASLSVIPFLGAEFIPRLDEGSILVTTFRLPGTSLTESLRANGVVERVLLRFPEVTTVVTRTGSPEIAAEPMGIEENDSYVMLKPIAEWPSKRTKEELVAAMEEALEKEAPGAFYSFTQPIEMLMQTLMEAGLRTDIAAKLYGEDMDVLNQKAGEIEAVLQKVRGAADTRAERVAGLPYLRIHIRRDAIARHGLNASDVLDSVEAMGGKVVGQVIEGNKRFFLQVRFDSHDRATTETIKNIKVGDREGHFIPLSQLADVIEEEGPLQIGREKIHRRITVATNVRGRDIASFVAEARQAIAAQVNLPEGYWIEWGGQFQQLESARARLLVAVPVTLLLIFVLLYFNFNSVRPALLIFLNVPLATTGGVLALLARGMPFSISAGVGFIALFGVAVLNGVVLVTYISQLRQEGLPVDQAVTRGAITRLRPVLMTALVASLGFVPMAISTAPGAEVQRPLATVVIGGLVTSTLLTLLVIPSIYRWFEGKRAEAEL
ncbi:MAG: cation transporter [Acidobacteria bacterium RIFCSPLOWO2_02_FULL_61_28]|nr:MAG: cation transporter [Acidobacteria bacterium RIFCSPLOWO2_02_FULL_61_28]